MGRTACPGRVGGRSEESNPIAQQTFNSKLYDQVEGGGGGGEQRQVEEIQFRGRVTTLLAEQFWNK